MNYLITLILITFLLLLPSLIEKLSPTTPDPLPDWLKYFLGEQGGSTPYPEWPKIVNQKVGYEMLYPHQNRREGWKLMLEYYQKTN